MTAPASAQGVQAPYEIRVVCARYSLRGVIWDRPMGPFLDDLSRLGYSAERAKAVGDLVCRDERFVGNPEGMAQRMRQLLASNPPDGN